MSETTKTSETEVNAVKETPVEAVKAPAATEPVESFSDKLQSVMKEKLDQINECKTQAQAWQDRGQKLQQELNVELKKVQESFGIKLSVPNTSVKPAKNDTSKTVGKPTTVPQLIRAYLEKNGASRTKDIRKYLLDKGKKTNPGVALSRMVKDGVIANVERGLYKIVS